MILCNVKLYCYMKNKKIKQVNFIDDKKSYIPNETLVNFIQEWLHLHRKKHELAKEGKDITREEHLKIRELDRMKVYILDTILFPAITDLTYFFEALSASPKLSEAFEDEVAELLDPRSVKQAAAVSGSGMRMSYTQFRTNNLARLIMAMLEIHFDKSSKGKPISDFRAALMYQMLNIVGDFMDSLITNQYSFGNQIWTSALEDYGRMKGWMALLAGSTKDYPREFDRQIGFNPIWFSNRGNWTNSEEHSF